ncbi:MAG: ABC transporter ATP-binding protein [Dehalococcoidia bacterium]
MNAADAVIEFERVSRTFPGPPPVTALSGANLRLSRGDYTAIVGPSGSGKSTLLHLVGLLDTPTEGRYLLEGTDTGSLSDRARAALRGRRIGFVFQAFHLLPHRDLVENVMLAETYNRSPREGRRARAVAMLGRLGLGARTGFRPTQLSGGERQRVAIARALITHPAVLLCDEPTGNLDSTNTGAILELLDELHAEGHTILMITHDHAVSSRAQEVLSITDGVLRAPGRAGQP